jgi:hypothetical protein
LEPSGLSKSIFGSGWTFDEDMLLAILIDVITGECQSILGLEMLIYFIKERDERKSLK